MNLWTRNVRDLIESPTGELFLEELEILVVQLLVPIDVMCK